MEILPTILQSNTWDNFQDEKGLSTVKSVSVLSYLTTQKTVSRIKFLINMGKNKKSISIV